MTKAIIILSIASLLLLARSPVWAQASGAPELEEYVRVSGISGNLSSIGSGLRRIRFSPRGQWIYALDADGGMRLYQSGHSMPLALARSQSLLPAGAELPDRRDPGDYA